MVAENKKQLSPFFKLLHCYSVAPFSFVLVLTSLLQIHMLETELENGNGFAGKWHWTKTLMAKTY